jgi:hypothetical protein
MNYKKIIKAINDRFLRGRQPIKRVCTASTGHYVNDCPIAVGVGDVVECAASFIT